MNYCSRTNMDTGDLKITSPAIGITARILFTLIFFLSGITHFTSMQSYIDLMPAAIPFRAFWVSISSPASSAMSRDSEIRTSPIARASASSRTTVMRPMPSASAIALCVISST